MRLAPSRPAILPLVIPILIVAGVILAVRLRLHRSALPLDLILISAATAVAAWFIYAIRSRHHGFEFMEALAQELGQLACLIDQNGIITYVNATGVEMLGHRAAEDLVGRHYDTFVPVWCRGKAARLVQAAVNNEHPVVSICTVLHASGEAVTLRLYLCLLDHKGHRHVACFADDVTEAVRIERLLSASFNAVSSPTAIVAVDGPVIMCNAAFAAAMEMTKSDVVGRRCLPFGLDPALPRDWTERLIAGESIHGELQSPSHRTLAAELHPIPDEGGTVTAYSVRFRDITEQKVAAERMVQAAKFAAVGQVAAGVAHNINNILAAIAVSAELLQFDPEQLGSRASRDILNAVDRGAVMVKQLYDLSEGNASPNVEPLSVARLLRNELELVGPQLSRRNITARIDVDSSLEVNADASLLRQVLMNLMINSLQAMPDGGCLTLAARPVGHLVELNVIDTGSGISPEHLDRIFTPFFTTKASASGTGLGLPTSLGMVRAMGGDILVSSDPGRGTVFSVRLPRPIYSDERQRGI